MPHHIEILNQTLQVFNAPYLEAGHGDPNFLFLFSAFWEKFIFPLFHGKF